MRINCGMTRLEKEEYYREWRDWFAWYPVRVGSRDCRWLETIQRTRKNDLYMWRYRSKT